MFRLIPLSALFLVGAFFSSESSAAIPHAKFILRQAAKNAGKGIYTIEQDVVFNGHDETLTLRETWDVNGDGQMRLTVRGPKELKDQLFIQNLYSGTNKQYLNNRRRMTTRITEDFVERYYYVRSSDAFHKQLLRMRVLVPPPPPPKPARTKKGRGAKSQPTDQFKYLPEPNVRLARHGGVVAYAFGLPSPVDGNRLPGFWFEQDQFFLRKFRLHSQVEVIAEKFSSFARGLWLPQERHVRWNQKSVQINLVKVTAQPASVKTKLFGKAALQASTRVGGLTDPEIAQTVEEFYQRFR